MVHVYEQQITTEDKYTSGKYHSSE